MGFVTPTTDITLTAKLTPYGREKLLSGRSNVITKFALGDSDANYYVPFRLDSGEVPNSSGNLGRNNTGSNSTAKGASIRSYLRVTSVGNIQKNVQIGSDKINVREELLGEKFVDGSKLSFDVIDRTEYLTDPLVNLFYSFRLPITDKDLTLFNTSTFAEGGYSDTALVGLASDTILVIGIDGSDYGEIIDGKSIKVEISGLTGGSYTIYSTYENTLRANTNLDADLRETSFNASTFGSNVAFLFSDEIQRPQNKPSKSWATGYGTTKPFSVNRKEKFNMVANTSAGLIADKSVGIAYLDKGFIVITDQDIVNDYLSSTGGTASTVTFNSAVTTISQDITCVCERGEFASSTNPTWSRGDITRISEVGLYDNANNLIALAKTDRHILKAPNQFLALGIKITV